MSATEVKAVLKFVRISPQKVRTLVDAIKGKPAAGAIDMLKFMPQKGAAIVEKVVRSAVANAEQNHNLDIDSLIVKNVVADQGPTLKRFRARARGRGSRILKRTAHITVVLSDEAI
jgi:large subunit ribosomal protein L22